MTTWDELIDAIESEDTDKALDLVITLEADTAKTLGTVAQETAAAIARVDGNVSDDWKRAADTVIARWAEKQIPFTASDLWQEIDAFGFGVHDGRALGARIRSAVAKGVIRKTGGIGNDSKPSNHGSMQTEWIGC